MTKDFKEELGQGGYGTVFKGKLSRGGLVAIKMLKNSKGRRKNIDAFAEHSSQIYFPLWVYDQLHKGEELVRADIADDDKEIAKKMMIVALWCIQLSPRERPSMSKVIEMLEGSIEDLHMPPKPLLSSPQTPDGDHFPN
ncbi:hypothetical protein AAC387_Pa05g0797 [Persea americana]